MPRKFGQDAKDRVVRLVEDRILAENMSMQEACKIVAPKLGVSWHTAPTMGRRLVAFVMACWFSALVLFIKLITVSTVCGKCGMLYAVQESISVVSTPPG